MPHIDGAVNGGGRQTRRFAVRRVFNFQEFGTRIGPYNNFDARGRVTVALFDPSAFERFQAAKKGEGLSKAELEKTREDVLALVATLFIDAQIKEQNVRLLKTLLDKDQMAYDLSKEGYSQGTETLLDSNKYKSDLEQTVYLYSEAKQEAEEARLDLEAALQLPLDAPLVLLDDKDFIKQLENYAVVNINPARNADTTLAASQVDALKANQKTAYADFLPKVSGSADYGRSGESPANSSDTYSVGVAISVPIWEGGAQQAQLKQVKSEIKEAQENLSDASQQEQVNITKSRTAIQETDDLRKAKDEARQTARRALRIATQAQETGSGTVLNVRQAKSDLDHAEHEYNEAQGDWVMAHINLLHAQGRLRDLIKTKEGD